MGEWRDTGRERRGLTMASREDASGWWVGGLGWRMGSIEWFERRAERYSASTIAGTFTSSLGEDKCRITLNG